jgi:hypothetical protein
VRRFDRRDRHGLRQASTTHDPGPAVRTATVERRAEGETVSLTGHIRAKVPIGADREPTETGIRTGKSSL